MVGKVIENYKLVEILGEGGMGIVYKALDLKLERYVAIKILGTQAIRNPQFVERFKREARNQAKLNHANIVPVYGFTEEGGTLGIVMEYIRGETLEDLIERKDGLELLEALNILKQILQGVGYAHSRGFIHRDLKPSNIIINEEGIAKIMDFGISKSLNEPRGITKTGVKIGTILYMSPEQIKAYDPTIQSDIYSIGILFYEILTGKNPFDLKTEFEIMEAHLKKNLPKVSNYISNVPSEIDKIIAKATNKTKEKRYATCQDFMVDVDNFIEKIENKIEKRTKEKPPKKIDEKKSVKAKFFIYAFLVFAILTAVFILIFNEITGYLKDENSKVNKEKIVETENIPVKDNFVLNTGWDLVESPTDNALNAVAFINDTLGIACGLNGTIIKTFNGGKNWQVDSIAFKLNFFDAEAATGSRIFICGENGNLFMSKDSLSYWEKIDTPANETFFDIIFNNNSGTGFIVGGNGIILKTSDDGINWKRIKSPTDKLLYSINFPGNKTGYIAGWDGTILKSTDEGNTWIELEKFTENYLRDIYFISEDNGFVVGGGGELYKTENGGEDWEIIPSGTFSGLYRVKFFNDESGVILGSKGEILTTTDAGENWKEYYAGRFVSLTGIAANSNNKVFIVGFNGTILVN